MPEESSEESPQRRVIVGVKDSAANTAAVQRAVAEARHVGAVVYAVHVVPTWLGTGQGQVPMPSPPIRPTPGEGHWQVRAVVDRAFGGLPADVQLQSAVVRGRPGHQLVELASSDTDVLVVGDSRRPGAWWSRLMPSVARYCARRARSRVVLAPPT